MALSYKVKCPHCNRVVESGTIRETRYGSPFRTCRYCGRTYFDDGYQEAGLLSEKDFKKIAAQPWECIFGLLLGLPAFFFAKGKSIIDLLKSGGWLFLIFIAIGCIPIVRYLIYNPEKDQKLQNEIAESNQRLNDPIYVIRLDKAGVEIPPYMLERAKSACGVDCVRLGYQDEPASFRKKSG